jgi:hypothetical protein
VFTIRRMTMADKPAMLEISSHIWEGSDYLPGVFDQWVADTDGEFAAVLLDGALVGCGKLTLLTPVDAWLEGLRKDPRVKEKGMAETVARRFLGMLARRPALRSIRFSTYVRNLASIAINERLGFRRRRTLSVKAWEGSRTEIMSAPLAAPVEALARVQKISDERAVRAFLERSAYFVSTGGLVAEGWRAFPYSPELLAERYSGPGRCRGIVSGRELRALSICTVADLPSGTTVRLVCLDALDEESAAIMMDDVFLGARAAVSGTGAARCEIEWMIPRTPRLLRWAADRGLHSWEQEDDFLVYELPLDTLPSFSDR